jgi:hypothetical protein
MISKLCRPVAKSSSSYICLSCRANTQFHRQGPRSLSTEAALSEHNPHSLLVSVDAQANTTSPAPQATSIQNDEPSTPPEPTEEGKAKPKVEESTSHPLKQSGKAKPKAVQLSRAAAVRRQALGSPVFQLNNFQAAAHLEPPSYEVIQHEMAERQYSAQVTVQGRIIKDDSLHTNKKNAKEAVAAMALEQLRDVSPDNLSIPTSRVNSKEELDEAVDEMSERAIRVKAAVNGHLAKRPRAQAQGLGRERPTKPAPIRRLIDGKLGVIRRHKSTHKNPLEGSRELHKDLEADERLEKLRIDTIVRRVKNDLPPDPYRKLAAKEKFLEENELLKSLDPKGTTKEKDPRADGSSNAQELRPAMARVQRRMEREKIVREKGVRRTLTLKGVLMVDNAQMTLKEALQAKHLVKSHGENEKANEDILPIEKPQKKLRRAKKGLHNEEKIERVDAADITVHGEYMASPQLTTQLTCISSCGCAPTAGAQCRVRTGPSSIQVRS